MMEVVMTIFCIVIQAFKAEDDTSITSDFSTIADTSYYVDKTLFIEDFLQTGPSVKVITAPSGFGKSTIIEMVKRFSGIVVDIHREQITKHYNLFCDPPLNICRDKTFVEKHLGKHPIIHIDYSPLRDTYNFRTLLQRFHEVIRKTFGQHKYLTNNFTLFPTAADKDLFIKHYWMKAGDVTLTENDILNSFKWLSELLHAHFSRKVIVLLDDYDNFCNSILFNKYLYNIDRIINFLEGISGNLFKYNDHLDRALLTGVLRVKGVGVSPDGNNVQDYRFLGDHKFSRYYGFTQEEVDELLKRNIRNVTKMNETRQVLSNYYDGYLIQNQNTKLYSTWSIFEFFGHWMKPNNYWVINEMLTIDSFKDSFKIQNISDDIINKLLNGDGVLANIDRPLSKKGILILREMNRNLEVKNAYEMGLFYLYLFDLGFLRPVVEDSQSHMKTLIIPNLEIQMEFATFMAEYYKKRYNFLREDIRNYQDALDYFVPGKNLTTEFKIFYRSVRDLIHHSNNYPRSERDLQNVLLVFAAERFKLVHRSSSEWPTKLKDETDDKEIKTKKGIKDVIVINSHRTAIVIGTKFLQSGKKLEIYKKK